MFISECLEPHLLLQGDRVPRCLSEGRLRLLCKQRLLPRCRIAGIAHKPPRIRSLQITTCVLPMLSFSLRFALLAQLHTIEQHAPHCHIQYDSRPAGAHSQRTARPDHYFTHPLDTL